MSGGTSAGGAHHIVGCEVCKDPIRHGQTITVGRKGSGRPRVIHDRPKCRRRWERKKEQIMSRWPESRPNGPDAIAVAHQPRPVITAVLEAAAKDHRPARVEIEGRGAVIVIGKEEKPEKSPPAPKEEEKPMSIELVAKERPGSGVHLFYKPELDTFILEWFKTHEWKHGAAVRIYAVLEHAHPDLLVDQKGGWKVTAKHLSTYIPRLLRTVELARARAAGPPPSEMAKVEKALTTAAECVSLGRAVVGQVFQMIADGDVDTLQAMAGMLLNKEVPKR